MAPSIRRQGLKLGALWMLPLLLFGKLSLGKKSREGFVLTILRQQMPSTSEQIDAWLRVVRTKMDALAFALDVAIEDVPEGLRDDVRRRWEEETAQPILIASVLS